MSLIRFLKRKWIIQKPFPEKWLGLLEKHVPVYLKLPGPLKELLKSRIVIFLDEKLFEGCGGLVLTDKIKIVIASYASVLILSEPSDYYPDLQSILVYPDEYIAPVNEESDGIVTEGTETRKGEYWNLGTIVLSWKIIRDNIYGKQKGQNLIYHEFAHQLDHRYGLTAGIDEQGEVHRDDPWTQTLAIAYRRLRYPKHKRGQKSVLDNYGATNPAEFFSVATEAFFENPVCLQNEQPGVYELLKSFYDLDPTGWN